MVTNVTDSHNSNGNNGHTTAPHAWRPAYLASQQKSWRSSEAPYTYTVKWGTPDGRDHFLCIREDSMDSLIAQVRVVNRMIQQGQQQRQAEPQTPQNGAESTNATSDDSQVTPQGTGLPWCAKHGVALRKRSWGGFSHKLADGPGYCKGGAQ